MVVVGAGWSGLAVAAACATYEVDYEVLEKGNERVLHSSLSSSIHTCMQGIPLATSGNVEMTHSPW